MLTEAVLVNEAALPVTTVLMLNASIGEHPNQRTKEEEHEGKAKDKCKQNQGRKRGFDDFILAHCSEAKISCSCGESAHFPFFPAPDSSLTLGMRRTDENLTLIVGNSATK